jgi:predicted MFS family arabinose efflux permease
LWIANGVSNLGYWMQQVAAAWLMTQLTRSPSLVALLATAAALPTFLFALPAGALADIVDRRRLIIVTQVWQVGMSLGLGIVALTGAMTPAVLLIGIAAYGLGNTLGLPPQSAIIPEIVEPGTLNQAIALNAMSFTAAQALGPAIGGAVVAAVGPGWAFIANGVSFAGVVATFAAWRRPPQMGGLPPEQVLSAMRTGLRYVRNAPEFQAVLVRVVVHMVPYAAIPALLVVAVRVQLHGGASGYGIALAAFGAGAVLTAVFVLPRLRSRVSVDTMTLVGAVVLAASSFLWLAAVHSLAAAVPGLFIGGGASMLVMSTIQASAQQALPDWVRGRGLAVVQLTFQAAVAVGAIGWGALASASGVATSLATAGAAMVALTTIAVAGGARLRSVEQVDLRPVAAWPGESGPIAERITPEGGPVITMVEYDIRDEDVPSFHSAMREVARARRRDGAVQWTLARDVQDPSRHVESFVVSSWVEHEREQGRLTQADAHSLRAAYSLHRGPDPPPVRFLLGHRGHAVPPTK